MDFPRISRRKGLVLAGAGTAALAFPVRGAFAQASSDALDWFAAVKQHHDMLERAFKALLAPDNNSFEKAALQFRNLDQLLGAHSFAEEMELYPALNQAGLAKEAQKFYSVEGHIKVLSSRLDTALRTQGDWHGPAIAMRDALLDHAHEEETDDFARLRNKLSPQESKRLSSSYALRFSSVLTVPPRR